MKLEEMINTIQLGDCYELIKNIPENSIDCIYTDIPYLIQDGGVSESSLSKRMYKLRFSDLENIRHGINYTIIDEFKRVLKKINLFIWCNKEQIKDLLKLFDDDDNIHFEILTWNKTNPSPCTNNVWLPDIEYCLYFREKGVPLNDGYENKSKWFISPINKRDKELYEHPTIKPLELVKRHLLHSTQENDVVLDCFCGSGTTCVAAKELDRKYIGIEIDKRYHKIANDRLKGITAIGQTTIFTDFENLESEV